jgi:hypothetical protein
MAMTSPKPGMTVEALNAALGIVSDPEDMKVKEVVYAGGCSDLLTCLGVTNCGCYSTYCCNTKSC